MADLGTLNMEVTVRDTSGITKQILDTLLLLHTKVNIMADSISDLKASVGELQTALASLQATVDTKQQAISDTLARLESIISDGMVSAEALTELKNGLQTALGTVKDIEQDVSDTPLPADTTAPVDPNAPSA